MGLTRNIKICILRFFNGVGRNERVMWVDDDIVARHGAKVRNEACNGSEIVRHTVHQIYAKIRGKNFIFTCTNKYIHILYT